MTDTHKTRVTLLRAELKKRKLNGFFVPRADEFQGEYVPAYAERLRWLTNFRGSAGIAIVTLKKAAIFVDGRYVIQVRQQVDEKIFQPFHLIEEPPAQWIAKNLKKGDRLGFDPWLVTAEQAKRLAEACAAHVGTELAKVGDGARVPRRGDVAEGAALVLRETVSALGRARVAARAADHARCRARPSAGGAHPRTERAW